MKNVLEIGCGLGDIIGNIHMGEKYACDIDEGVLRIASVLHPSVNFFIAGTGNISINKKLSIVIMVNFIHRISPEELKKCVYILINRNNVDLFVIDVFKKKKDACYEFSHDGEELFGNNYQRKFVSRPFVSSGGALRYIEYWERNN